MKRVCIICKNIFTRNLSQVKIGGGIACGIKCSGIARRKRLTINCFTCKKEKVIHRTELNKRNFCNKSCKMKWQNTIMQVRRAKKHLVEKSCKNCRKKVIRCLSKTTILKNSFCSRGCLVDWKKGANHPMWKGGIAPLTVSIRKSKLYKAWRSFIFKRDNYICQICGDSSGGNLQANHIKKFSDYPELIYELKNGITLCKRCHISLVTHKEPEWESYFNFNLMAKGFLPDSRWEVANK